jgi:4-amino-4-deoxy-L-arabinose transferase-like glycosyltransferase
VGRFGREELTLALALLPGILLGFAISGVTAPILDRGYTRTAVLVLASVAALVAIGRQVL